MIDRKGVHFSCQGLTLILLASDGVNYTVNGDTYVASNPPLPDTTAPTVTSFRVLVTQATFSTHVVKVRSFTATDPGGSVTSYKITESSSKPGPNSPGWTSQKPKTYKIRSTRTRALCGWAKDSAGNVSEGRRPEDPCASLEPSRTPPLKKA